MLTSRPLRPDRKPIVFWLRGRVTNSAGQPELVVGPTLYWRVPVQYAPSRRGTLGIVGHLQIEQKLDYSCLAACTRMVLAFSGAQHTDVIQPQEQ